MAIGTTCLIKCINSAIETVLEPIKILQLTGANLDFENGFVKSVPNCSALPNASCNLGRLIFVENLCAYRWSDGVQWSSDFSSPSFIPYGWGINSSGQLGNNTTINSSSPTQTVTGITNWCQVSSGSSHTLGLQIDGILWSWGSNQNGQLGSGTVSQRSVPALVIGDFTDWCQVSAGGSHSIGLRMDGSLWQWGSNNTGELGDNTAVTKSSPVQVIGGFTDWSEISAGCTHNIGLRQNGTLWTWGSNTFGELGDNTASSKSSPVQVVGGFNDWCQISAGGSHSMAIRQNGTAWSWGSNYFGQLGSGLSNSSSPVSVVGNFTDWCQVSSGGRHSLGIRKNGTLWAWGLGGSGQLGNGQTATQFSPVSVVGGFTNWCKISAGWDKQFGLRSDGTLWAWGVNSVGDLGDGTTVNKSSPVLVSGGITSWYQVSSCCSTFAINAARN